MAGIISYLEADNINFRPVSLAFPLPVTSAPQFSIVSGATVSAPGTVYATADTITVAGGDFSTPAVLTVTDTKVVSAAVVAGGTGGTPGAVTIIGTTGTGTKFHATGTISAGGVLTGALVITVPGDYTVNPTSLAAEPVTGGGLTGATVSLVMGVLTVSVTSPGEYASLPANPAGQASTSGTGTGATFTLTSTAQATDQSISDGSAPDTSGTITASAQSVTATNLDGYSTVTVTMSGTYASLSGVFEQSDDSGTTWFSVDADRVGSGAVESGVTNLTNATLMWRATCSGSDSFRFRSTALTSGTVAVRLSITAMPTASGVGVTTSFTDIRPDSGNITTVDIASTSTAGYHGALQITGAPTAASSFSYAVNGVAGWYALITGTWTGTLSFEKSLDGGTTWVATSVHIDSTAEQVTSVIGNCSARGASAGATNIRVRATAAITGTAVVRLVFAAADTVTTVTNLITDTPKIVDAVFSTLTRPANATPYSINDSISDNATAASVTAIPCTLSDVPDMPVTLTEILLDTPDTGLAAGVQVRAFLFNSDPTASTGVQAGDNAGYSQKKLGFIGSMSGTFRAFFDGGKARLTPDEGTFIVTRPGTGVQTIWIQFQTLTAFTPSTNSTTIIARARGFQDRA